MAQRRALLAGLLVGALVAAVSVRVDGPIAKAATIPTYDHVFVVVMENHSYGEIIGSSAAPYVNSLTGSGALATNYVAVAHPSLPNYLALTGASTYGVTSDCTTCWVAAPNVADNVEAAGKTWKAYEESMPGACFIGDSYPYVQKHDPLLYYNDIRTNAGRCAHVVPYAQLGTDLASAATTPNFAFITPNMVDDMHDGTIQQGDAWLSQQVPQILRSPAFTTQRSLLALVWDEDDSTAGNQVATILVGSGILPGFRSGVAYDHYSLLHTIEAGLGLATLTTNDGAAAVMGDVVDPPAPTTMLAAQSNSAYGGYVTVDYIENIGNAPATMSISYSDSSGKPVGIGDSIVNVPPNAMWTVRQDSGSSFANGVAGSGMVISNQPVAAFTNEFAPSPSADATSFSGVALPSGAGTTLYAPAIANGAYGGYTTGISLVNKGDIATNVTVVYRDGAGNAIRTQTLPSVPAHAYQALYSGDPALGLPASFDGTATITSSSTPVGAVVNETGPGGEFSSYDAVPAGSATLYAPVALDNAYGGFFTGMGIQNTTGTAGTVTITYYSASGTVVASSSHPIQATGYLGIYQGTDLTATGAYTAKITSTVAVAAIVNEVAPSGTSAKQATAYVAFPLGSATQHLPLVESAGADGWSTGEGIMNTGATAATVTVAYYDPATGAPVGTPDIAVLQPNAYWGLYQPRSGLPAGARATATVSASVGTVAVICNQSSATTLMSYGGQ